MVVIALALRRRPRFTWSPVQLSAAAAYCGTVFLFVLANKMTTAANAILLQYTAPVYAAILGWRMLGEKVNWRDWLTLAIVLGGMTLFFVDKLSTGGVIGNILALASGVSFALLVTLLRKQRNESPLESVLLGNAMTALVGLPFALTSRPGGQTWLGLLVLGTLQLGLSYVLFVEATRRITALEAVLVPIIEPILNPIWVLLLLHEAPGPWAIVGGVVVLATVSVRCAQRATRGW